MLAQCPEFKLSRRELRAGERLAFARGEQPRILSVVAGELEGGGTLKLGDNVLLPYAGEFSFQARKAATVLVTEDFSGS